MFEANLPWICMVQNDSFTREMLLCRVTHSGFANNNRLFVGAEPSQAPKFLSPVPPHSLALPKFNVKCPI